MSFSFKADNELITAIRDRAMFNTFAGNQSYVIKGIGQELAVTVTPSTLNVSVGSGEAVICGGSTIIDSDNSLTLGANESGYLVIRIDLSQTQENICQFMKVPTLIQQNINNGTDLIYDLPLYQYTTNTSTVTSLVDVRSIRDYANTSLDGGTQGQVLTKRTNNNGDYGWLDTDYMEVDTLGAYEGATPINANQLEGHNASYFAPKSEIGTLSNLTTTNKSNLVSAINEVNTRNTRTLVRVNATTSYVEYDLSDSIENYNYFILTAMFYGNIISTTFVTKEWLVTATSANRNIRVTDSQSNATYSLYLVNNTKVAINSSSSVSNAYYCALIGMN